MPTLPLSEKQPKMLISVIVPVYNTAPYLSKCLDSILAQSHRDLEIILIDDGSEDNSGAICDEYAKKDRRIKAIHQANGGQSSARNAGLDIATGAYIAFVDSDDSIMPEMFSAMLAAIERENADLAICGVKLVDENDREVFWNDEQIKNDVLDTGQALRALFRSTWYTTHPNKLHKYGLWQDIRFPVGKIMEDNFTVHHIFAKCHKVVTLEDKFYLYIQRSGSTTSNYSEKHLVGSWDAFYDRYLFFKCEGKEFKQYYINSIGAMYNTLIEASKYLDFAEHKQVIEPLYKKTFWLLLKYGKLRTGLSLYKHYHRLRKG
jgi:glycosyltransferase involved in cell wall biosynthesis